MGKLFTVCFLFSGQLVNQHTRMRVRVTVCSEENGLEWFAKGGERPIADNGKLYSVAALKKLIALEKAANTPESQDSGIAGQLFSMCLKIEKHEGGDWSFMGDPATALAALFTLREKFEALQVEQNEQATELFSVTGAANAAIDKASMPTGDALMQALKDAEAALI